MWLTWIGAYADKSLGATYKGAFVQRFNREVSCVVDHNSAAIGRSIEVTPLWRQMAIHFGRPRPTIVFDQRTNEHSINARVYPQESTAVIADALPAPLWSKS